MKQGAIFQTIIAILGLLVGYPLLGNVFILLMTPLVIYMVVKKDAGFLPALMIHCASETSIMYVVFLGIMFVCLFKFGSLWKNGKTRFLLLALVLLFPLYLVLTIQKIRLDAFTWQAALHYTAYYLSFWAFLYCFLIADTFDKGTVKLLLFSFLFIFILIKIIPGFSYYRVISMIVFLGVSYGLYLLLHYKDIILGSVVFLLSMALFFSEERTFTQLLTLVYSITIFLLWIASKKQLARKSVYVLPYVIIVILMIYGVNNYETAIYGSYSEHINYSNWSDFSNRAKFKFFADRSVFWSSAWNQLITLKPILPIHDIPDIIVYKTSGKVLEDVGFGAHNTPLQLMRIFGFIMGGVLIIIYIYCTALASKIIALNNNYAYLIPMLVVVITNMLVLFLTGTAAMLPGFALFSFGLCGIAFGRCLEVKNI